MRAIEREQFDPLREQVFVRGCLHSYARFLGLDPSPIVSDYARRYEAGDPSPIERLDRDVRIAKKPPRPRWHLAAAASAALLLVAGLVGVLGGAGDADNGAALPAVTPRLERTAPASRTAPADRVTLTVEATRRTFVAVLRDGRTAFEGEMAAGEVRTFAARGTIEVVVANGGTVRLAVNGEELGVAGPNGAVYRARFGPRGRLPG